MANIYEYIIAPDSCRRPVYTSYELSKQIKNKRREENMNVREFAMKYQVSEKIIEQIEDGTRSFSPQLYKACAKILELSLEQILEEDIDNLDIVNYRTTENNSGILDTVELANTIFNEVIMQKKISAN